MKAGDIYIVTGDSGNARHRFARGTEVELTDLDPHDNFWHCSPLEYAVDRLLKACKAETAWLKQAERRR